MLASIMITVATSLSVYFPSPHDKDGWGLRVHNFTSRGPFLAGESIAHIGFEVTLINFSKETREHDPLPVARVTRDLSFPIIQPDSQQLPGVGRAKLREPFTQAQRIRPGEINSEKFQFAEYGLARFLHIGRYRLEPTLKIDGKTITAPPIEFEVVVVPPSAVLASHAVKLERHAAKESSRPVIQQVPLGNRTLLIYRSHYDPAQAGGGAYFTTRLAELPGKVEMAVEGAYGDGGPLAITYRVSQDAPPTRLVIHSVGGSPWTQADQDSYDFKHHVAPAPRSWP